MTKGIKVRKPKDVYEFRTYSMNGGTLVVRGRSYEQIKRWLWLGIAKPGRRLLKVRKPRR